MVNNARADDRSENRSAGLPENDAPRTGTKILHDAAEQTAQTFNDALSDAARMAAERISHAAQDMVDHLDLRDLPRRAKEYARRNPLQFAAIGVTAAVLVGLIMSSRHTA